MNHKLKNNNSPFFRWLILCISLLIPFLLISWKYIKGALSADASGITYIIFFVFLYGFISSIWISIYIAKESRELKKISDIRNIDHEKGGVHKLFSQSLDAIEMGSQINFEILLTAFSAKRVGKIRTVSATASILITIGLLGTIIGLILTIDGISSVLGAAGENYADMVIGLNNTVQGMGTAFYTTLFGGLLGGVILKALSIENEKAVNSFTADCLELGELWIMPLSRALTSKAAGNLQNEILGLMNTLRDLSDSIAKTSDAIEQNKVIMDRQFENLVTEAKVEMSKNLQEGLNEMAQGFAAIVNSIEIGHEPIKQKMSELSEAIGEAASATSNAVEETKNVQNKILDGRALELATKLNAAAGMIEDFIQEEKDVSNDDLDLND